MKWYKLSPRLKEEYYLFVFEGLKLSNEWNSFLQHMLGPTEGSQENGSKDVLRDLDGCKVILIMNSKVRQTYFIAGSARQPHLRDIQRVQ